jgi:hypothetical protein
MASLDDIINTIEEQPELIIETNTGSCTSKRNILFTFDHTKPADGRLAYDEIEYLDSSNAYMQTKPLGKYVLKNHQLTTLYYMMELEKMLFDVKRIVANPDNTNAPLEVISTHYTNVGVLSDKVGAGKSYCVMALLNEAKTLHSKQLPFRGATWGCNKITSNSYNHLDTNILLVPHGLVGQWKKYLKDSGLKFYTIQKAKDIFELVDASCGFKGKQFSMIVKEDDERVRPDDGDEELDDDNSLATTTKKKIIKKKSSKDSSDTSNANDANSCDANSCDANSCDVNSCDDKIKKKKVITKRSKSEVAAIQAEKTKENSQNTLDTTIKKKPTIRELENEKRILQAKIDTLRFDYYMKTINDAKYIEYHEIQNQISKIIQQLKSYELEKGLVKITDIHNINYAFENNSIIDLPESLKFFTEIFGHLDKRAAESHDVILISATFWNLFSLYLNRDKYTVNRVIVDECNAIKGNRMLEVRRGFTWLITSSIQSMMTSSGYVNKQVLHPSGYHYNIRERTINSTGFILTMIKELFESKRENYKIYLINRPEYIEASMTLPELKTILVISKDNANIQVLQGVVSHDVLQMLNAGDISGVITKLDVAVGDENNVIEMVTRKYHDELRVKEYELRVAIENPKYNPACESISLINKRTAIADLKRKIACIEERVKEVENCPICYDDFTNPAITPCCSNKFCLNCIAAALNSRAICPMCKSELDINKLLIISDKTKEEIASVHAANTEKKKSKQTAITLNSNTYEARLEELKTNAPQLSKYENMDCIFALTKENLIRKYLIFTEYENTLNSKITSILDKYGLTYARIRGTSASITNMVETYRKSDNQINVLLINSKYFGSGLNLENTSDIIILHKMHADIEMQVIGRAHRYGRKESLRVWKLYYQNEVSS